MSVTGKPFGKYIIQQELGKGGFATVYLAIDPALDRPVALKILHPHLVGSDQEFINRFRQEAKVIARLEHPHIVPIYEFGEFEGQFYLATKYMSGGSLANYIKQKEKLSWEETVRIIAEVAEGLDMAHRRNFLHRDIKPDNILLDENGKAVLADFGVTKVLEQTRFTTQTGGLIGTPAYIAPEIWQGEPASSASDLYALACCVSEMLTGQKLFDGPSSPAVMRSHFEPPVFPKEWPAGTPAGLPAVLAQALHQNPFKRPNTVAKFAKQLANLSSGGSGASPIFSTLPMGNFEKTLVEPAGIESTTAYQSALDTVVDNPAPPPAVPPVVQKEVAAPPVTTTGRGSLLAAGLGGALLVLLVLGGVYTIMGGFTPPAAPTFTPTVPVVAAVTETETAEATATAAEPTPTPSATPTLTATSTEESTATPEPSRTPTAEPTATLTATATATSSPTSAPVSPTPTVRLATSTPRPTATSSFPASPGSQVTPGANPRTAGTGPGLPVGFESFGVWGIGDQPYGSLTSSSEQVHEGGAAGKLAYDFPTPDNDYVVFLQTNAISGNPNAIEMWVYGDASGHFLNVWIVDAGGQTWQVPLGRVQHTGWQKMRGYIDPAQSWPWFHISGPKNEVVEYPISFRAIVLDDSNNGYQGAGVIYVDSLTALFVEGYVPPTPSAATPTPTTTP